MSELKKSDLDLRLARLGKSFKEEQDKMLKVFCQHVSMHSREIELNTKWRELEQKEFAKIQKELDMIATGLVLLHAKIPDFKLEKPNPICG